jgi:2-phosphoglycerate kinase
MTEDLRPDSGLIYWLGGSPCSGKSTIAKALADQYDLRLISIDAVFESQQHLIDRHQQPVLYKWTHTAWDELWSQPHQVLLSEAISAYQEHFDIIIADLVAQRGGQALIVEGTALLPDSLRGVIANGERAMWVVPSEPFQRQVYPQRGEWVQEIIEACNYPDQAMKNWMDRDVAFARWVLRRARALGYAHLVVDGSQTIQENTAHVARYFGLV